MSLPPDDCPTCGAKFFDGLCPQCLLLAGMESAAQGPTGAWKPPSPEEFQAQLPQYKVLNLLGRGGMGAVYQGWQNSLERYVAIKILPENLDGGDANFAARFKQEAKTMAKLSHPGIVAVIDAGETTGGLLYFVMEFVEGTDVARMVQTQGRLPPEYALAITAHVCDALAYAHEHGVSHRDIKPANIMLNHEGQVKVADFGLAKSSALKGGGLTKSNMTMGTPDYIAPEGLIPGIAVDHRADLYAVGVMLYNMLTGEIPRGRFRPASEKAGSDVRFDAIVEKAMETERERRYQSAREIRHDLDKILATPILQKGEPARAAVPAQAVAARTSFQARLQQSRDQEGLRSRQSPWLIPTALIGIAALAIGGYSIFKPKSGEQAAPRRTGDTPVFEEPNNKTAEVPSHAAGQPPSANTTTAPVVDGAALIAATKDQPFVNSHKDAGMPALANAAPVIPVKALPAELAMLHEQFLKLQGERVTAPFDADVAKLNSGYLGGLDREIAKEKAAGHLDSVLALEEEKQRVADKQPMAGADDEKTFNKPNSDALAKLRGIYREANARLEQQSAANLKLLTDPLVVRLRSLESNLTKKDRIVDAKTVRKYRESLGSVITPELADAGSAKETAQGIARAAPSKSTTRTVGASSMKDGFTNTLGMKFVPVPITGGPSDGQRVLFSVWETRVRDYEVFAKGTKRKWPNAGFPQGPTHPAVQVSWEDAQAFCMWLTEFERKAGKLGANDRYRLPTDHEWSCAVGIGDREDASKLPEEKQKKIVDVFPWGTVWPPPIGAGNYSGEEREAASAAGKSSKNKAVLTGYNDGHVETAPVGSFPANSLGLHDLGGNVREMCEDLRSGAKERRVHRGGSWSSNSQGSMLSSDRGWVYPNSRYTDIGFRCVVVTGG